MSYPTSVLKDSASSLLLLGYSLCLRPTLILLFPHLLPSSSLGASLNHDPHSRVQALVIGCQTSQGYLPEFLSIASPESLVFVFYCQITILCSLKSTLYLQIALFLITWSPSVLVSPISDIPDEPPWVQFATPMVFPILLWLRVTREKKSSGTKSKPWEFKATQSMSPL